jgi:lipopolysaccharide transport system permease protein
MSRGRLVLDERADLEADGGRDPSVRQAVAAIEPVSEAGVPRVTLIRPASRWPHLDVRELWHYRELLGTLVWRDVKVRYKQTFVGVAWALLVPIFTAAVYILIFGKFAHFPSTMPFPTLVLSGLLPMQYFTSSLSGSSASLVSSLPLVTKVYFPRVLLPLTSVMVPLVDLVLGLPVLIVLCVIYRIYPGGPEVFFAPLFIGLALITALGIGLFLSAVNVRYRDVPYMLPVFISVLPLLSGVMYSVSQLPEKWQWLLYCNPMTAVISGWRWAVLDASFPDPGKFLLSVGVATFLFVGGLAYFRSYEPRFADTI